MYHIFSKLFDSQDLGPHLTWPHLTSFLSKVVRLLVCVFYGQNKSKILQNLFHALLNNSIKKKTDRPPPPPKKKKTEAVKDRGGGVEGRYDCSQRFNGFFLRLPLVNVEAIRYSIHLDTRIKLVLFTLLNALHLWKEKEK